MNEKFEPIKFDSWQELAKFVIDGGEVYYDKKEKVIIDFDRELMINLRLMDSLYIKKQPTLEELIAIKPRLCWVWDHDNDIRDLLPIYSFDGSYYSSKRWRWNNAQMLTDDEIKQFLNDGE